MSAVLKANRPTVMERSGVQVTEYTIVGSLDAVLDGIKSLFRNYPAAGYGTYVHSISMQNYSDFTARVSRSNSCD